MHTGTNSVVISTFVEIPYLHLLHAALLLALMLALFLLLLQASMEVTMKKMTTATMMKKAKQETMSTDSLEERG